MWKKCIFLPTFYTYYLHRGDRMVVVSTPDYRRNITQSNTKEIGINRYRKRDEVPRGFLRTNLPEFPTQENTNINPLSYLIRVPRRNLNTPIKNSNQNLTGTIRQRGINTYRRNNDLLKRGTALFGFNSDLYQKTSPGLRLGSQLFQKNTFRTGQSIFDSSLRNITGLMQQGIMQYNLIDKTVKSSNTLLRNRAALYLKSSPKLLNASRLFV